MQMEKLVMSSIAQIRWIIKEWEVFLKDYLPQVHGVALMSLTDWFLKCCLCAQSSLKQLQMQLNKRKRHSYYKMMSLILIQHVEYSLQ